MLGTADPRCALNRTKKGIEGQRKAADLSRQRAVVADAGVRDRILLLRNEGLSYRAIADRLNTQGVATRAGCYWSSRQVQRVVDRAKNQALSVAHSAIEM